MKFRLSPYHWAKVLGALRDVNSTGRASESQEVKMGDIRAGLEELKLDVTLFANVKYYISGEPDNKVLEFIPLDLFSLFFYALDRNCWNNRLYL